MKKILFSMFLLVFGLCLVGCIWRTGPDITNGGGFNVYYDYGTIEENKITILIDNCLPFFDFDDYNIEQLYPGDTLYIDYTGKPVIEESYPGRMTGIEVNHVELYRRTIREISEEKIVRNELNGISNVYNYSYTTEYVILNEELDYVPLSEYTGTTLYASEDCASNGNSKESKSGDPKPIPIAAFFAFNPNEEKTYNLNIQNDTDYELINIKDNYKEDEEVVVKLEYEDNVETFVYLNDEYIGYLNGRNHIKFKMPKENSTLKISYEYLGIIPTGTYKLNIIDNNDYIMNKPKEYESHYAPGTEIILYAYPIMDADLAMYVNGKFNSIQNIVFVPDKYIWEYRFVMPAGEVTLEFKIEGIQYTTIKDLLEIPLINSSDVVKVRYEEGAIGVAPGTLKNIKYSTNLEDIDFVLSLLEFSVYDETNKDCIMDGGGYVKYSIFTKDNSYDIKISNDYIFVNNKYYKFMGECFSFNYPSTVSQSYITYQDSFEAYSASNIKIGDFEGLSEFEFYPWNGFVIGEEEFGYIETEFGKVYIHNSYIFYIKEGSKYSYYCISGEKDFREIFNAPHDHEFVNKVCECKKTVYDYIKDVFTYDISYYKTNDAVEILSYFGEFDGCYVAVIKGDKRPMMVPPVVMEDIVINLYYENISVYYNNKYYLLEEAIELNILTYDSVKQIRDLYYDYFGITE